MVDLESGDLLLMMTDGITEPRNTEGVMYEESGRLYEVLSSIPANMPIEEVVDTIVNDVEAYTADEEQDDDITLVWVGLFCLCYSLRSVYLFTRCCDHVNIFHTDADSFPSIT